MSISHHPFDFPPCVCSCCNLHYNQCKFSRRICTGQLKLPIRTVVEGRRTSAPSTFTAEYVIRLLLILFHRADTVVEVFESCDDNNSVKTAEPDHRAGPTAPCKQDQVISGRCALYLHGGVSSMSHPQVISNELSF